MAYLSHNLTQIQYNYHISVYDISQYYLSGYLSFGIVLKYLLFMAVGCFEEISNKGNKVRNRATVMIFDIDKVEEV